MGNPLGRAAILERRIDDERHRPVGNEAEIVPRRITGPEDADEIGPVEADDMAFPDDEPRPFADERELGKFRLDVGDVLVAVQRDPPSSEPKFVLGGAENDLAPAAAARPMPEAPRAIAPEPRC